MFRWFKKKEVKEVVVGSIWELQHKDPFNRPIVEVVEIKDGWVKFRGLASGAEMSRPIKTFLRLFKEM